MRRILTSSALAVLGFAALVGGCSQPEAGEQAPATSGSTNPPSGEHPATAVDFEKDVKPTLQTFCVGCHQGEKAPEGVDMTKFDTNADAAANKKTFAKMAEEVEAGKMPPAKAKRKPTDAERAKLVEQLKALST